jgi:hypothetical protein
MRSKRPVALAMTALLLLGGAACGGDDSNSAATTTEETHAVVPDAAVTKGLAATQQLLADIQSGKEPDKTKAFDDVEAGWSSYEGTIKQNEVNMYLDFEDALAAFQKAFKANNTADATTASTKFATTAQSYLAKHP